jgi:hypothetical protein
MAYQRAAPKNLKVSGISGCLYSGITVDRFEWKAADGSIETVQEGLRFQYSTVVDLVMRRRIVVENFTIDRATTKILRLAPPGFGAPSQPTLSNTTPSTGAPAVDDQSIPARVLRAVAAAATKVFIGPDPLVQLMGIHELRISDYSLEYPKMDGSGIETVKMNQLRLVDFLYENATKKVSLAEFFFADDKREFGLKGLSIYDTGARLENVHGRLKVAYDPDRIRQDIDFNLKIDGSLRDFQNVKFSLTAVGGKVRVTIGPQMAFQASFVDVTVREVYQLALPITHLNLELSSPNAMGVFAGMVSARGDFKIGETAFRFSEKALVANATVGPHVFTVQLDPTRFSKEAVAAQRLPLFLRSSYSDSSQDNLSQLYFQRRYADLDEVRRLQIDTDLTYFDRAVPASRAVPVKTAVRTARPTAPAKVERYPANERPAPRTSSRRYVPRTRVRR